MSDIEEDNTLKVDPQNGGWFACMPTTCLYAHNDRIPDMWQLLHATASPISIHLDSQCGLLVISNVAA